MRARSYRRITWRGRHSGEWHERDMKISLMARVNGFEVLRPVIEEDVAVLLDADGEMILNLHLKRPLLWVWMPLPDTVCAALKGRPLTDLIDLTGVLHKSRLRIREVVAEERRSRVSFWTRPRLVCEDP